MKRRFRIIVGMLLLAIPLCVNAQVNPGQNPPKDKALIEEKQRAEKERFERKEKERRERIEKENMEKAEKDKLEKEAKAKLEKGKPEKPNEGKGGIEMPRLSGFVQGMYMANLNGEGELTDNTLRMRRVRLSVEGNLFKGLSYKIQGDFSRSPMLVDAFLKYKVCDAFAIQLGQFKTPFSLESPINPVNLEIFDYGEGVQKLVGYSDVCGVGALGRDLGIMASGDLFPVKGNEKIDYYIVNYSLGVFNGNGANALDNNNRKDIVGRINVHPGLKDLTLSGSYYNGSYRNKTVEEAEVEFEEDVEAIDRFEGGRRNRWTAGVQYYNGKLIIRSEYFNGQTGYQHYKKTDDAPAQTYEVCNSKGYYAVAGYNFTFGKENIQKLMPVLRYEHFAKDTDIEKSGTNWYTIGLNYWPIKSVNFKLDYSLVQKESGSNSHRVVGILSYKF